MKTHVTIMMLFLAFLANTAFADPESQGELYINIKNNTAKKSITITVTREYSTDCGLSERGLLAYIKSNNDWQLTNKYKTMQKTDTTVEFQYQISFITIPAFTPPDTITWGKYQIQVKSSDNSINNYIFLDWTDENFDGTGQDAYRCDVNIDYIIGDNNPFQRRLNESSEPIPNYSTIGVWKWDENNIYRTPMTTGFPLPAPDLDDIGISPNYCPLLSFNGCFAAFPVAYDIYRKRNTGNYSLIASVTQPDTCTIDEYEDEQITTNGTGDRTVYYYVVARNATPYSQKVSDPSPVKSIHYYNEVQKRNGAAHLDAFDLYPNYPNPFNPSTVIPYRLNQDSRISLCIYNLYGQLVRVLVDQYQTSGIYETVWNGKNALEYEMPSGVYFCRLTSAGLSRTKKIMLLK